MHISEIRDYWNQRANGFSEAVDEELNTPAAEDWARCFAENLLAGADVLDVGTGAGFFPALLAPMGHRVTAIDDSDGMAARARARFEAMGLGVDVRQMDAQALEFPDSSFDAVVTRNVLWNLDDPEKAYREIARVLRPGGLAIVEDGNMYLYLHNEAYAAAREKALAEREKSGAPEGLHGRHNADNVDFSIIERIAEDLPMSRTLRPQWDFCMLTELGFDDIRVTIQGGELPMGFRIIARSAP